MIGFYAERIARAGLIGFAFTGAPPSVHPHGGIERIFGTNPFAIAFPTANENPVLIDMATSAVSNSYLRQAAYYDEEIPEHVAVDAQGKPTKSAHAVRKGGSIAPLAGHKGFGLSLAVALLAGPLVGAQTGKAMNGWRSDNKGPQGNYGHFLFAVDPACFGDPQNFRKTTSAFLDEIRSSQKAPGVAEIRIPGRAVFRRVNDPCAKACASMTPFGKSLLCSRTALEFKYQRSGRRPDGHQPRGRDGVRSATKIGF